MWRNQNPHRDGRAVKLYGHCEKQYVLPLKVKHRVMILPSNSTPRKITKRSENVCSNKSYTWMFLAAYS